MFTAEDLLNVGFELQDDPDGIISEYYVFKDVAVWNLNNECWIIDMLDQNGVDIEYMELSHLNEFFKALGRSFM